MAGMALQRGAEWHLLGTIALLILLSFSGVVRKWWEGIDQFRLIAL